MSEQDITIQDKCLGMLSIPPDTNVSIMILVIDGYAKALAKMLCEGWESGYVDFNFDYRIIGALTSLRCWNNASSRVHISFDFDDWVDRDAYMMEVFRYVLTDDRYKFKLHMTATTLTDSMLDVIAATDRLSTLRITSIFFQHELHDRLSRLLRSMHGKKSITSLKIEDTIESVLEDDIIDLLRTNKNMTSLSMLMYDRLRMSRLEKVLTNGDTAIRYLELSTTGPWMPFDDFVLDIIKHSPIEQLLMETGREREQQLTIDGIAALSDNTSLMEIGYLTYDDADNIGYIDMLQHNSTLMSLLIDAEATIHPFIIRELSTNARELWTPEKHRNMPDPYSRHKKELITFLLVEENTYDLWLPRDVLELDLLPYIWYDLTIIHL